MLCCNSHLALKQPAHGCRKTWPQPRPRCNGQRAGILFFIVIPGKSAEGERDQVSRWNKQYQFYTSMKLHFSLVILAQARIQYKE
jgi:hypothetical protein